ncbi:MAG: hypothetical protein IPI35_08495 [Deltaproteobacteria bacterium]|nr:hypothetical protein [Deltaproteobacteria bacterium]
MSFVIGLIGEGPTDFVVLEPLIKSALAARARGLDVEIVPVQPGDATSGGSEEGGWLQVKAWCLRNRAARRRALYFEPLFEGFGQPCHALLVQLDADLLHLVPDLASKEGVPTPAELTPEARGETIRAILNRWLWPEESERLDDHRTVRLAAVWSTETWLVAAIDPALATPEAVDPNPLLLKYSPGLAHPTDSTKLKKNVTRWKKLRARVKLTEQSEAIIGRCPSLGKALSALSEVASTLSPHSP